MIFGRKFFWFKSKIFSFQKFTKLVCDALLLVMVNEIKSLILLYLLYVLQYWHTQSVVPGYCNYCLHQIHCSNWVRINPEALIVHANDVNDVYAAKIFQKSYSHRHDQILMIVDWILTNAPNSNNHIQCIKTYEQNLWIK